MEGVCRGVHGGGVQRGVWKGAQRGCTEGCAKGCVEGCTEECVERYAEVRMEGCAVCHPYKEVCNLLFGKVKECGLRGFLGITNNGLQMTFRVRFRQYFNFHFNNIAET